jgi:hypothetical protein
MMSRRNAKMHAIRQRFNLYAGGSLSADVRRFFQLINADEVPGTQGTFSNGSGHAALNTRRACSKPSA